jgi:glycosyltransferase involved in cell wall biosynthesis
MITAAMVTPNMTLGGAERWIVDLIKHTDPERVLWTGVAVSGFGGADKGLTEELSGYVPLFTQEAGGGVARPPHALPFCYDHFKLVNTRNFSDVVREATVGADVVVTWGSPRMGHWFSQVNVPRVLCSHTTLREEPLYPIEGITHLTAVSEAAMTFFDGRESCDLLPKTVIYNGADPARVEATRQCQQVRYRDWKIELDDIVIGYLGRQTDEKNPHAAALAAEFLGPPHHAIYYGWGKSGKEPDVALKEWCEDYLEGRCRFYPPVSQIGDILGAIDVFMLASQREAFSLGLIEAWLAGVPVVATPVGSLPELEAIHGPLTFEVPIEFESMHLADAVRRALADRDGRVARAQQVAKEHFTVQAMARRWENYLTDVVNGRVQ